MKIHFNLHQLPIFTNAVITIGTFDGVHLGHQQILNMLIEQAKEVKGESVVITFHPHPKSIVAGQSTPLYILNTLQEKITLLENYGIEHLVVVPFTNEFAEQNATDYVSQFLVKNFNPHTIIIGYDHKFGKERKGDYLLLELLAPKYNFLLKEIPAYILQNITISSTNIRQALLHTKIEKANELLGYTYFFEGIVIQGNKLGRTIDYPTANLQIEDAAKLIPANGVYAVSIANKNWELQKKGMMNIGIRPTVNGTKCVIEINIFDFDEDIYGQNLQIIIHHFLRTEVKFNGLDELKNQLAKDKMECVEMLK